MNDRQDILETHPHLKDFFSFLPRLNEESDRGAVLIAATMIENLLSDILSSFFIKGKSSERLLSGFNAPLGTFSSKIEACLAMGLVADEEYADIEVIRKIRNTFAHTIEVNFGDRKVKDLCANLYHSAKDYGDVVVGTKGQFTTATTSLILNLTNRPHYVSKARLKKTVWPY